MSKADVGDFHLNFASPMRCFSSRFMVWPKNLNRNESKTNLFIFLKNAPAVLGGKPLNN